MPLQLGSSNEQYLDHSEKVDALIRSVSDAYERQITALQEALDEERQKTIKNETYTNEGLWFYVFAFPQLNVWLVASQQPFLQLLIQPNPATNLTLIRHL